MNDDKLLKEAKQDIGDFVDSVVQEIYNIADLYKYEPAWVLEEFKLQMQKVKI